MIEGLRELLRRQGRLQRSFKFKVIASIVMGVLAIGGFGAYVVAVTAPGGDQRLADALISEETVELPQGMTAIPGADRPAIESMLDRVQRLREAREDKVNVALGMAVVLGVNLVIIWLGLALTYLEVMLAGALIRVPVVLWSLINPLADVSGALTLANILLGTLTLAWAFIALIEGVRALYSALPGSIFAIARNTVLEAVRMKVSIVFIVMLIFGLAALPGMLNDDSPLRYRVQAFLQYGTAGSFWIIAILTIFFSAATVAFEQRDRQIWQTMTKPVASWQYVLGKWLGVVSVAATLLIVSTTGVFMFVEYLRTQPAVGESQREAAGEVAPSKDREILETQVLVARTSVEPSIPPEIARNGQQFQEAFANFVEQQRLQDPNFAKDDEEARRVANDLYKGVITSWRTLEPATSQAFIFEGLRGAATTNAPVILRYRIDAGANAPDQIYTLTFAIEGRPFVMRETGLGHTHTMTIAPMIEMPHAEHSHAILMDDPRFYEIIRAGRMVDGEFVLPGGAQLLQVEDLVSDGELRIDVINGDLENQVPNPESVNLPLGEFQITYAVGSYRLNYVRSVVVLWLKLAFLTMLAICCSTFLSFPVACLVSFGAFLAAESAGFLSDSLMYYDAVDRDNNIVYYKAIVRAISLAVAGLFQFYADMNPTRQLIDGRLVPWINVVLSTVVLGISSFVLYLVAVLAFWRRELATYSGN